MEIKKILQIPGPNKADGSICVAEGNSLNVPFNIKRVYYSYGAETGTIRGKHAHKTLEQILICVHGQIEVTLDNGKGKVESIILKNPSEGLYINPSIWHIMKWIETNSVLLVLASEHYDEKDYMRNYNEFLKWAKEKC